MNLKSAARALGVHYQTAYRWVRSGDLPAVRHGDGYEISDEAINVFVARRDARRRVGQSGHAGTGPEAGSPSRTPCVDALISETQELIRVGADTPRPALSHLLRGIAELFDVLAVVHVFTDTDPVDIATTYWWHADTHRHALWSRMLSRPDVSSVECLSGALDAGHTIGMDHIPLELARTFINDEFWYLLDSIYPHAVNQTPLLGPCRTVGVMSTTIDRPGRVFTVQERESLERLSEVATAAIVRAWAFSHAARLREYLHSEVTTALAADADPVVAAKNALAIVDRAPGSAFLMTPEGSFVATSDAFKVLVGRPGASLVGDRVASIVRPEDEPVDRKVLARLWTGELDHITLRRTRETDRGPVEVDAHWSVVRWPDLRPAYIVATQSRVAVHPSDWLDDPTVAGLRAATRAVPDRSQVPVG